jgi:ABC-type polysaccharide/polyol phosphate transport system ATPase subunit
MDMGKSVITFENVSKIYRIYKNRPTTLKEKVVNSVLSRNKLEVIQRTVLNDCSFTIQKGETVGIIGENGAGKSTTLKLIAKIIRPDKGDIVVNGTVASLLEIGAGFQPDLTGRENVFLYGAVLGLSKKYVLSHYDEIVRFSELEDFMDTPVKNYSSGMYMRLAFAVAIHVDPDILLIDEVLAVGDENFQKKCLNKIDDFQNQGKTVIFVSHDMSTIRKLCDRVIFIEKNGNTKIGDTEQLVNLYFSKIYMKKSVNVISLDSEDQSSNDILDHACEKYINDPNFRWGNQQVRLKDIYFSGTDGQPKNVFGVMEDIVVHAKLEANVPQEKVVVGIAVYKEDGTHLSGPNSKNDGLVIDSIDDVKNIKLVISKPPLLQGTYLFTIAAYDFSCRNPYDHREKHFRFSIVNEREELGSVKLNCEWIF